MHTILSSKSKNWWYMYMYTIILTPVMGQSFHTILHILLFQRYTIYIARNSPPPPPHHPPPHHPTPHTPYHTPHPTPPPHPYHPPHPTPNPHPPHPTPTPPGEMLRDLAATRELIIGMSNALRPNTPSLNPPKFFHGLSLIKFSQV